MTESVNDGSETVSASIDDLLNMLITALNEITLVSEIPNIIHEENVIIAPGKKIVLILCKKFCEE